MSEPWWEEGHNPSSYFWIMPVKQGKDQNDGDWGCYCCVQEQISIEEDIVLEYLYHQFLESNFDKTIEYTCRKKDFDKDFIEFDWYGYNLYTYDTVRKMAEEMKQYTEITSLNEQTVQFYKTLADRLLLMIEREPDWDFISFEGP